MKAVRPLALLALTTAMNTSCKGTRGTDADGLPLFEAEVQVRTSSDLVQRAGSFARALVRAERFSFDDFRRDVMPVAKGDGLGTPSSRRRALNPLLRSTSTASSAITQ
jgi:hypothetical protein